MIFYKNNEVEKIEDNFLYYHVTLKSIKLSNAKEIGNSFLCESQLKKISLPKAEKIGFEFLSHCKELKEVNIPNAEEMEKFSFLENKRHKILLKLIVSNNLKEYVKDILNDERNILEEQEKKMVIHLHFKKEFKFCYIFNVTNQKLILAKRRKM